MRYPGVWHGASYVCSYFTHSSILFVFVSMALKPYQLIGLNWLKLMHTQEVNGILADEMVRNVNVISYGLAFCPSITFIKINEKTFTTMANI